MRRLTDPKPLPKRRVMVRFAYPELGAHHRDWRLVIDPQHGADIRQVGPGLDIDLLIMATLRAMTAVWMGTAAISVEIDKGQIALDGDPVIAGNVQTWLGLSPFAKENREGRNGQALRREGFIRSCPAGPNHLICSRLSPTGTVTGLSTQFRFWNRGQVH
jgi:hypothetical protein